MYSCRRLFFFFLGWGRIATRLNYRYQSESRYASGGHPCHFTPTQCTVFLFSLLYKITLITVSCSRFFAPLIYHSYNLFYYFRLLNLVSRLYPHLQKVRTRIACQNKISHWFGLANRGSSGLLPKFLSSEIARDGIRPGFRRFGPPVSNSGAISSNFFQN